MNRSIPAPCGASAAPEPDDQVPEPDGPQQLELRLFERLDQFRGPPPEKGLWRELLDIAISSAETFTSNGMTISASFVHHVAWALFGRTDRAGIAETTDQDLANDIRRPKSRTRVTAALSVMRRLRISRPTRLNRRGSRLHQLNLGGIDWPAVRRRAAVRKQQLELPSGLHTRQLELPSGLHTRQLEGVRTGVQISEPIAAAVTPRASTAGRRRQEQQQRREDRIEGLFAAIAARAREAGHDYDERDERRRLAEGEIDVDRLQALADRLLEDVREQRLRRAHGPSYGRRR
ncbi:MAG: hypothetical protein OXT70_03905 [Chloroflexota bacterium]|nr:hypothetical protein [Chloroflexota bacterium]